MIGRLTGLLAEKNPPFLLIDINGVGYDVQASMTTIYQLPAVGDKVTLYTHLVIREDAHTLFAFFDQQERELFTTLIKVNGIGPKMALAILSATDVSGFALHINQNDVTALTKIPGIGKKTAERLMIEMRDKLSASNKVASGVLPQFTTEHTPESDAFAALVALGYPSQTANQVLKQFAEEEHDSETLIRLCLKKLSS